MSEYYLNILPEKNFSRSEVVVQLPEGTFESCPVIIIMYYYSSATLIASELESRYSVFDRYY